MRSDKRHYKEYRTNPQLGKIENALTILMCFLFGISYDFFNELIYSTTNDLQLQKGGVSFVYGVPVIESIVKILTVFVIIGLTSAVDRYSLFIFCIISALGQLIVSFVLMIVIPILFWSETDYSEKLTMQMILIGSLSFFHGIFSTLNFSSFFHVSSLLSNVHLLSYIVGVFMGPLLTSFADIVGYELGGDDSNLDLVVLMVILVMVLFVSLMILLLCYFKIKSFRMMIHIEPTNLMIENKDSLGKLEKMKILFLSSLYEMKVTFVQLKHYIISLTLITFTMNLLYPGLVLFYPMSASAKTDSRNEDYIYANKVMSLFFNGFSFVGCILTILPYKISKRSIISMSIFCTLIIPLMTILITQGGMVMLQKDNGKTSFEERFFFV